MSQNYAKACIKNQYINKIRLVFKKYPYQKTGNYRFQKITHEYHSASLHSHDAQGVGAARVAASMLAYIDSMQPAVNIARLEQPKSISQYYTYNSLHPLIPLGIHVAITPNP